MRLGYLMFIANWDLFTNVVLWLDFARCLSINLSCLALHDLVIPYISQNASLKNLQRTCLHSAVGCYCTVDVAGESSSNCTVRAREKHAMVVPGELVEVGKVHSTSTRNSLFKLKKKITIKVRWCKVYWPLWPQLVITGLCQIELQSSWTLESLAF